MNTSTLAVATALSALLAAAAVSQADRLVVERFTPGPETADALENWEEKRFVGSTDYRIVEENGDHVLRARADSAASGLFRDISFDTEDWPIISWRWKVTELPAEGDVRSKETDDYGARLYVVFPRFLKWRTKTINYIWSRTLPAGESTPNTWLPDNAVMIAVRSGYDSLGVWLVEKRNVREDYRRVFGEYPPDAGAIAIMTDADNTGGSAEAYYDDIVLLKR